MREMENSAPADCPRWLPASSSESTPDPLRQFDTILREEHTHSTQHQRLALGCLVLQRYEERVEVLTVVAPLIVKIAIDQDLDITVTVYVSGESLHATAIVLDGLPAVVCRKLIGKPSLRVG